MKDSWTGYKYREGMTRVLGKGNNMVHGTELGKITGIGSHDDVLRVNRR